jgi:tetratricopeptide (TPR) repeat protein
LQPKKDLTENKNQFMKKLGTFILLIAVLTVNAQKKKAKEQKAAEPVVEQKATEAAPDTVKKQQANPLIDHFVRKYQLAIRWGDEAEARDAIYDLIAENAVSDSIIYNLALSYYDSRQYAPALLVARDLLTQNPKSINLLELTGASYEGLGLKEKALPSYEAIYLQTSNVGVLYKMAALQFETKKYPEAITNLDIILTKPEALTLKASFNDAQGKPKEYALKVSVLNLKGLIVQETDKVAAKKIYAEALALAPDFVPAKENLAKLK